jgi:hypothetical protein
VNIILELSQPMSVASMMNAAGNYRVGRICLHLGAMALDRQFRWHLEGIGRELSLRLLS